MKFIKEKLLIILSVVLALFCLASFGIAVRASITMVEKKWQLEKAASTKIKKEVEVSAKAAENPRQLEIMDFYLNGKKAKDIPCFKASNGDVFISLEHIAKKLGSKLEFFGPDDIVQTDLDGKKSVLKLWSNFITINDQKHELKSAPYTMNNMVLVPSEMFQLFGDFNTDININSGYAYMSYYPGINDMLHRISLLRQVGDKVIVSDITDKNVVWTGLGKGYEYVVKTPQKKDLIIKSGELSYILDEKNGNIPQSVDVNANAYLSFDGDCFYWIDYIDGASYIQDINGGERKLLGNYDEKLKNIAGNWNILRDYVEVKSFKRVVFSNSISGERYGFIERKGKLVVEGNMWFSPDKAKVIYKNPSNEYYIANSDGSDILNLGQIASASWLNNNSIVAVSDEGKYLLNRKGKKKQDVSGEWKMVGTTADGGVLYQGGNELFSEQGFEEKGIMGLPWNVECAFEGASDGKYILVSDKSIDKIIYTDGQNAIDMGKMSCLFEESFRDNVFTDYKGNFTMSPDNGIVGVVQKGEGLLYMNYIKGGSTKTEKIILGFLPDLGDLSDISMKWISGDVLLVNTTQRGWIVDFKNEPKVYRWIEKVGSKIEESFVN